MIQIRVLMVVFLMQDMWLQHVNALVNCTQQENNEIYRLSNNTIPLHYEIDIKTNLEKDNFKFNGTSAITISMRNKSNEIALHSKMATIEEIELKSIEDGESIVIKNCTYNSITDILKIESEKDLDKDSRYNLSIKYSSYMRNDNLGFYKSSYINETGNKVWLGATQFAPTQARHAFPSFDEPRFKTTFNVRITHPSTTVALSNMNVEQTIKNENGTITTIFERTPIMSTYLIGFVISDFNCTMKSLPKIKHQICGRHDVMKNLEYAESFGATVLSKFIDYFSVKLPIETMKHVALPDFHFSGMENWGITTYRESRISFDSTQHSSNEQISLVTLMAHEMAHNWFGNLVTMRWWTYVWLKEGFSTLYQYYGSDMVFPDWKMVQYFIIRNLQYVFQVDGEHDIRPMSHYVEIQSEIMANYDRIAYEKSACILRMIENIIGEDIFKRAVNNEYLTRFKFSSIDEDDFIKVIENISPISNMSRIIKSWTSQSGYPVVTVERNYNLSSLTLSQQRFLNYGLPDKKSVWHIPITYETSRYPKFDSTKPKFWLTSEKNTFQLEEDLDSESWIILNVQQTGYYRVNYDSRNWKLITKGLIKNHTVIHVLNRAQLIDDAFNLAQSGHINFSIPLNLLSFMKNETEYAPWAAFDRSMDIIRRYISEKTYHNLLTSSLREVIEPAFMHFGVTGFNSTIPLRAMTRQIIVKYACTADIKLCLENSLNLYPNMRTLYFCNKLRSNTDSNKAQMELEKFLKTSEDSVVRSHVISSIGCSKDRDFLRLFILYSVQDRSVFKLSSNERYAILYSIYQQSNLGLHLTLDFLVNGWRKVHELFSKNAVSDIVNDAAKYVKTEDTSKLLLKIIFTMNFTDETRSKVLNQITRNLEWKQKYEREINLWIEEKRIRSGSGTILHYTKIIVFLCILSINL